MKKEKNIILCSVFALTIGIAMIVPLAFFMDSARAQTDDEQWFNIDPNSIYAYYNAEVIEEYDTNYTIGDLFQATGILAFDVLLNDDALSQQQHINARVEFFEFLVYAGDTELAKSYGYVGLDRPGLENSTILSNFRSDIWFNDPLLNPWLFETIDIDPRSTNGLSTEVSFNIASPIASGGRYISNVTDLKPRMFEQLGAIGRRGGFVDEISDTKLSALKDTQTIYLDIRRIGYVIVDDSDAFTASKCDQLIQHIELTKNNNGEFTFGNTTEYIEMRFSNLLEHNKENSGSEAINGFSHAPFW